MSYQVLARKWRPQRFEDLVGQEHVQRALVNALKDDRLHHAYLFTGTRGVGKTTIARIFSKALNCETGISANPCGECATCVEIAEGRYVDLIEVDAASRTGVDDTRELLENVQYAPTRGRYKVYLIDEVHMFSKSSFNALLKTLEEPPPHVKFLLATTDPEKLPVTILSRCLQFNLKRLPLSLIIGHLQHVLTEEKVEFNLTALQLIAEAADGSMRDALSLLDQALAFGGGAIQEQEVRDMLGTVSRDRVIRLLKSVLSRDAAQAMQSVADLAEYSPDYENVLAEMLSLLHHMSLARVVPESLDEYVSARDTLLELSNQVSAEDLQLFYQIALIGRRDLSLSPDPRGGFEMVVLRMLAFRPASDAAIPNSATSSPAPAASGHVSSAQAASRPESAVTPTSTTSALTATVTADVTTDTTVKDRKNHAAAAKAAIAGNKPKTQRGSGSGVSPDPKPETASRAAVSEAQTPGIVSAVVTEKVDVHVTAADSPTDIAGAAAPQEAVTQGAEQPDSGSRTLTGDPNADWPQVIQSLALGGQVKQLASNCSLKARHGSIIQLQIESGFTNLLSDKAKLRLQQALGEYYDVDAKLEIEVVQQAVQASPAQLQKQQDDERQQQAVRSIEQDSFTRSLKENFDAEIVPGSIRPVS